MLPGTTLVAVVKAVVSEFRTKNVTFMAGSIAYNAFVSLAPLLVVTLLATRTFAEGLRDEVIIVAQTYLTPGVSGVVIDAMTGGEGTTSVSALGLLVAVWGSLKIFRNLDTAFSEIFESEGRNGFLDQLRDASVVMFALLVGVVGMVVATAASASFEWIPFIDLISPALLVLGLCVAFFPLFYVFPDVDFDPLDVLPGVVVAAAGWALLQAVFQVYVKFRLDGDPSDAATIGLLILVVTWLYFSGIVLLLGALVNAVLTGHAGNVVTHTPQTSSASETRIERDVSSDAAASYLMGLREDVAGRYERMRPMRDGGGEENRPRPTGPLTIEERAVEADDGDVWEVRLSYPYHDESGERNEDGQTSEGAGDETAR